MLCDNKIRGSHRRCLAANKCLSVRGLLKEVEGNKGGPLPSPAVLSIVGVREIKPSYKKMKCANYSKYIQTTTYMLLLSTCFQFLAISFSLKTAKTL